MERIPPKELEEWKMALDAPLPHEAELTSRPEPEMWGDEEEAAAWAKASGGF